MPKDDLIQIRAVLTDYLEGMIWADAGQLRRAFHPSAVAAGNFNGEYLSSAREDFIPEWIGLNTLPRGTPFAAEIVSIEVTGDIAIAKLTNTCFGDDYTDFLTLTKPEGRWQIIAKAWFVHPKVG